jgi:hypothetical protein
MELLMLDEHNLFVYDLPEDLFTIYKKHSWIFPNITFCQETNTM